IGHREGRNPNLPVILFGSHIDSVPHGGNYDGDVGVLGALECIEILNQQNFLTAHPLEVIVFSDEEGGLTGSRAVVGELSQEALQLKSHSERPSEREFASSVAIRTTYNQRNEILLKFSRIWNCTSSRVEFWKRKKSISVLWKESLESTCGMLASLGLQTTREQHRWIRERTHSWLQQDYLTQSTILQGAFPAVRLLPSERFKLSRALRT